MSDTTHDTPRDAIEDLLPWYANGRISPADRARVEAALAGDAELARRLALVREEMGEAIAANEALPAPSARAFDRVMAGIDAAPRRAPVIAAVKAGLIDRLGELLASLAPRRLALAAMAVAALMVVEGATVTALFGTRTIGFQTASQGTSAPESGAILLVAFAPQATLAEVAGLLARHGAVLAGGPRANGFYDVRLTAAADADAVKTAAAAIRAESALVRFVQVKP